ncbi:hypothetical protein C8R26_101218 [Nitrosomonas oligotropha]|uniref:NADPH-dependent FMN reductase-like domain-containing protein n=1 Tax=Nitrosomonas oligotropha TaxID=42354 RepID=A0A2T5I503_9PROT|nr:NAD(P)H-dependent oxidoreductase [Nitrosomonas oligotropha]PTQ78902.1 hypothetical protein C8R26_101218 [Nitrosomonas oligotropha]
MPNEAKLEIVTLKGIPLYDEDIEVNEGIPQTVIALQKQIAAADGLLLATQNTIIPYRACSKMRLTGYLGHQAVLHELSVIVQLH